MEATCDDHLRYRQGCGFYDFSAASAASASAASASASTKNIVILLVANPPMSAEALDSADRFRFRFPGYRERSGRTSDLRRGGLKKNFYSNILAKFGLCSPKGS